MKKRAGFLLLLVAGWMFVSAQIQSPETFLGYKPGTQYTPHFKIINYFNHVAAASPAMVKLQAYGQTYEGRPLIAAFISSEENINNLEDIRKNNLRLANMAMDKAAPAENAPVIVWLSYNVHGNEASSSEAAMLTLYELVNSSNTKTKEWLKHTVVVIDPCINPDGRDRYVNWFNSIAGKNYNPRLDARERYEPWPGGRTNHYNFDLNRDWAWQTQIESQQRLKLYQQWFPQIHADYHEQDINAPYYFAPAAQPYHEAITPWQRDFQVTIGKNNAAYFDARNWLFFTKEIFDLYYPSYGDTYPLYNGAIGMTYEQGGGPASGLGVYKKEGDTLTLTDRLMHHHTTALSTIETASQNANRLIREFRKFFNDAVSTGTGVYKTYIIKKEEGDAQRMAALTELLDKNNIQYGSAKGNAKGYNYFTGKEEAFTIAEGDIVISNAQPKSTLLSVLFEPTSKLVDSATYDITAWALPYVYGVTAYAVKEKISIAGNYVKEQPLHNAASSTYGYVIPWEGVQSAKAVAQLMQKGVKLRFAAAGFEVNDTRFKAGAIIILKTSNGAFADHLWKLVAECCNQQNLKAYPVSSGFVDKGYDFGSENVKYMKAPKIALVTGEGVNANAAGEVWFFMERELNYPVTLINSGNLNRANWNDIDVLILPDGRYPFLNNKDFSDLKSWISKGGRLIAMENAVAQLAGLEEAGIKFKKDDDDTDKKDLYAALKKFGDHDREFISSSTPGSIYKVQLDNSHPLAFGYPGYYYTLKMDDHVYEFINNGWNVGVIKKDNLVAGFVGSELKKKLNDGLIYGVQDIGSGNIVYMADDVLFRNFWQNGKLMFCNALFLVGQ
ncbi:M14 family metallopeptidase [Agriterribacter sp.]|uniref:M14 family metallopeptidase n=1 Tax=Agriterribacter sp. TaxID=2821509 RepID=UPI002CD97B9C|nr:M14 family metallopeptidase [Agriterribacter sp.]HRO45974.1 M14 family metallopeptidase [Agriterribacter sp.]HRQ18965.1 M14 family metallopeptidase [Agriterribacter sp.]